MHYRYGVSGDAFCQLSSLQHSDMCHIPFHKYLLFK